MSKTGEVVEYGAMGVGLTVGLFLILAFFPTIMVSFSLVDTFYDTPVSDIPDFYELHPYTTFFILAIIIGTIQIVLVKNIRYTWGIVVPWFLLSIHPTIYWIIWIYTYPSVPFFGSIAEGCAGGVNWMPW